MSRLDRVLVSREWLNLWSTCKRYVQTRQVLDHCAIIVKSTSVDWGPRAFRTLDTRFVDLVKSKWNSYSPGGEGMVKCKENLK